MNFQIHTLYPAWLIIVVILIATIYSFILYSKNSFNDKPFYSLPNILLLVLRFFVVAAICFLLLSPFIKKNFERTEKPVVVIAIDNSESVLLNKDSISLKNKFSDNINNLSDALSKKYEVKKYTFGQEVNDKFELDFSEKRTNISQLFDFIYEQFYNRNIGAIVLASDGIYNEGQNPISLVENFKVPIYSIALGDTFLKKDILIKNVRYNSVAFAGNKFPLKVKVVAEKCKGENIIVNVKNENKNIYNQSLQIKGNYFEKEFDVLAKANEPGLQKITISLTKVKNEISYSNNQKIVFIDVLKNKKKILLLSASPHPDINAIKSSLRKKENYEVISSVAKDYILKNHDLQKELKNYDLLILHQLPSKNQNIKKILKTVDDKKIPVIYILGTQTAIKSFNLINTGLKIFQKRKSFNKALAITSDEFNYFNLNDNAAKVFRELPPLIVPFGNYKTNSENQILLYQKIGNVKSNIPLIIFFQNFDKRSVVICGEGIWKWALIESRNTGEQIIFDELIEKTVQFVSLKKDKRFFRLKNFKNVYFEDKEIIFEVELFNRSFEKMKNAEIKMKITNDNNESFDYTYGETEESYKLNAGYFPAGSYSFTASTKLNNYSLKGNFIVKKVDLEYMNSKANHDLMYSIAKSKDGNLYYPNSIDKLKDDILARKDIKPLIYFDEETKNLINLKWLFFAILTLITIEWVMRKYLGSY